MIVTSELQEPTTSAQLPFVNIASYLFVPLDKLPERREELRPLCKSLGLKGTILLSPEGINIFMAGSRKDIDQLLDHLRSDPLLEKLEVKESYSQTQPFSRLLVKLKKEIIAFGIDGIAPRDYTSKKIPAGELKRWLDEGRPVTLLDTRNDYEVDLGTFENALPIGVGHFKDFPEAVRKLPEELKEQPIVMFCTGGIRCEKAGPFMEQEGFREVYQLEGGILKYFEECGGVHYNGDCFVFDHRVALNPNLEETATTQCYACQHPLTVADQESGYYEIGKTCPYCWTDPTLKQLTIADREQRIREVSHPLPGSISYTNERPLNVPLRYENWTLIDFLCDYHPHVTRENWEKVCQEGCIRDRGQSLNEQSILRPGQRLLRLEPDTIEPDVNADIRILDWDEPLVIFEKPAPLPMHPCGRFYRNSMTSILDLAFPEIQLRPAHRLDANTTGLVLFTSHRDISKRVQRQFEKGQARKTYLCRVNGQPEWSEFVCSEAISRTPNEGGFRGVDNEAGDAAETQFRVLERYENGEALIEARPITGRTNQIRVHLWHLGIPICGDPVYLPNGQWGDRQTLTVNDPPMCLHAWKLTFNDPETNQERSYESNRPAWAE